MKNQTRVVGQKQKRWDVVRRKEKVDYDVDPPRCSNCIHKRSERIGPKSKPQQVIMYCRPGNFSVKPFAICNSWTGADGSTLE